MIDFNNATFVKLRPVDDKEFLYVLKPMLVKGEHILSCYKAIRDGVIFTNYRIIAMNAQGITGTKKDFTSLPYSKIQAYSVETSGILDNDCELDMWFSGLGKVRFEFVRALNIGEICKIISERVLDIPQELTQNLYKDEDKEVETVPAESDMKFIEPKLKTSTAEYCSNCYRMLEGDPEFCPKCGKKLK